MSFSRRDFIRNSGMAAGLLTLNFPDPFVQPYQANTAQPGFELRVMATNWGFPGDIHQFCAQAKKAGYDGIEVWAPGDENGSNALAEAVKKNGLFLGLLCGGGDPSFPKHLEQFTTSLKSGLALKPIYINCHSGRDYFSFDQNKQFIDLTTRLNRESGIPIYHETHRGRSLFAAHTTRNFVEQIKELRLTFDVSHWCNVHESLLADQADTINTCLARVEHIHARIGHAEGPQVNDPRAPEWEKAVAAHFSWWDQVVDRKRKEGKPLTILTEFGPPDYMPTLPYTRQALSSQWDINTYMMQVLRKRYLT